MRPRVRKRALSELIFLLEVAGGIYLLRLAEPPRPLASRVPRPQRFRAHRAL
jgi:hypothetical protein